MTTSPRSRVPGHAHQADKGVDLGKVATVGAELFPDVRCRIQADDVHAVVAEVEHIRGHIIEYDRVCIVQIPLIGVESGHDDLACLLAPGEVAGCCLREYLRDSLFEFIRDGPVVIEEISVLIFLFACAGALCPLVIFAGVVHNEVEADAHAAVVAVIAESGEVFHGAESRLHLAEVCNGISAVAAAGRALQQRHQVYIVQTAFLQIIQVFADSVEGTCKAVGIHQHTQHLVALVPLRNFFAHLVPLFQDG